MDATRKKERPDSADGNADDSNQRKGEQSFLLAFRLFVYSQRNAPLGGLQQTAAESPVRKFLVCNKYNTAEGCMFGERCFFAHGQQELGMPVASPDHLHCVDPTPTLKISVAASLAGLVLGKGVVNAKNICELTGASLTILDHESDLKLKSIELEGTHDQIDLASRMVRDLIDNIAASTDKLQIGNPAPHISKFKTKICDNFRVKGFCSYGNRCHFAHGESELRKGPSWYYP
ncbi:zinc finger CCCH domain-containing protein 14-like [Zingiber officinale]|uniref:zinc finger CCCH domain-containing protein 14-like n=1 Tax=Zingiber officinale TaxID=94328 RepID=UPI001C4C1F60|nr:zinc finger CCCH domain-containing protein 14-like [Zingiber officinale]